MHTCVNGATGEHAAQLAYALIRTRAPHTPTVVQIHVTEGALVCPHCERRYPIRNGIPNMLLNEDEV